MSHSFTQNQIVDPMTCMVNEIVVKRNCDGESVAKIVEKMYELGLRYDDFDAVMKFMDQEEAARNNTPSKSSPVAHSSSAAKELPPAVPVLVKEPVPNPVKVFREPEPVFRAVEQIEESKPMMLIERLDLAAEHSSINVNDSLKALLSWATVAITPQPSHGSQNDENIDAFFQSHTLELLLCTFIRDALQWSTQDSIRDAFAKLLIHVMQLSNSQTRLVSAIVDSLTNIITTIYKMRLQHNVPAIEDLQFGSLNLAKQIADSIRGLYLQLVKSNRVEMGKDGQMVNSKEQEHLQFLQQLSAISDEIAKVSGDASESTSLKSSSSEDGHAASIQNLFMVREMKLDKLQLCLKNVEHSLQQEANLSIATLQNKSITPKKASPVSLTKAPSAVVPQSNATDIQRCLAVSKKRLELFLLQESRLPNNTIESKYNENHSYQNQLKALQQERDAKLGRATSEFNDLRKHSAALNSERDQLKAQLDRLDRDIGLNESRLNALQTKRTEIEFQFQQQSEMLMRNSQQVQQSYQVHDNLLILVDTIGQFESKFAEALLAQRDMANMHRHLAEEGVRSTATPNGKSEAVAPGSATKGENPVHAVLPILNEALVSYVNTEAECIAFLTSRVKAATATLEKHKKELAAFQAIGMKNLVGELEEKIGRMGSEIEEDRQSIRHLQKGLTEPLVRISNMSVGHRQYDFGKISVPKPSLSNIISICSEVGVAPAPELVTLANFKSATVIPQVLPPKPVSVIGPSSAAAAVVKPIAPVTSTLGNTSAAGSTASLASLASVKSSADSVSSVPAANSIVKVSPSPSAGITPSSSAIRRVVPGSTPPAPAGGARKPPTSSTASRAAPAKKPVSNAADAGNAISMLEKRTAFKPKAAEEVKKIDTSVPAVAPWKSSATKTSFKDILNEQEQLKKTGASTRTEESAAAEATATESATTSAAEDKENGEN